MAKGCTCLLLPLGAALGILALGASIKTLETSPVGRQLLGWVLTLLMLGAVVGLVRLAWWLVQPVVKVGVRVGSQGWSRLVRVVRVRRVRPQAPAGSPGAFPNGVPCRGTTPGGVPQGNGTAPLADAGDGGTGRRWLVEGVVPYGPRGTARQYVTGIAAKRGTGKSFVLLDLAVALLSGQPWLGWPLRHCAAVLYVDLELDGETLAERAAWLSRGRGLSGGGPPPGLHYLDLSGEVLRVPTREEALRHRQERCALYGGLGGWVELLATWLRRQGAENRLSLWGATTEERIRLRARRVGAQAILVDSLTLGGGIANGDDDGWRRLLKAMEWWGAPVVVLDHSTETGKLTMLGSFAKEGLVRSVLKLERRGKGRLLVTMEKANFGPAHEPFEVADVFHQAEGGQVVAVTFTRAPAPPTLTHPDSPPSPRPLPTVTPPPPPLPLGRPVLRVVPPASAQAAEGALRGHAAIDARVMEAVATQGVDREVLSRETGYAPKTVSNALSRLRRAGALPRPDASPTSPVVDDRGASAG